MSSSTITSDTPPTPTTTSDSGPFTGANNRGANYFFGFLITFIALLLLFIGCGIGTRRRLQRNGRLLDFSPWDDSSGGTVNLVEPRLLEPRLMNLKGGEFNSWASIQPLSSSLIPPSLDSTEKEPHDDVDEHNHNDNNDSRPTPVRMASSNPIAYHGLSLPVWLPAQRDRASKERVNPDENAESADAPKGLDLLQVAVLVAMPSQHKHDKGDVEDDHSHMEEFQFGVAQILWEEENPNAPAAR